ncbi:MAG: hypothetical protein IJ877_02125 [Candidatus Gastranaerophilales bacterium]|nr:hypothetical protein [Candidatus Gastranaerophilales bacterium]
MFDHREFEHFDEQHENIDEIRKQYATEKDRKAFEEYLLSKNPELEKLEGYKPLEPDFLYEKIGNATIIGLIGNRIAGEKINPKSLGKAIVDFFTK